MAMEKARISETVVERAVVTGRRYIIADKDIPGFWFVVSATGKKSFVLRYRVGGGRGALIREPKIGAWPAMKAAKARSIAAEWLAEVRLGGDPGGARKALRIEPTMNVLFDRYLSDHARPTKKPSSLAEDEQLLRGKGKVMSMADRPLARYRRRSGGAEKLNERNDGQTTG